MISDVETIEIRDESTDEEVKHQLYVDGCRRAFVRKKQGYVTLHWEVYGPQQWPEAKNLLQGVLQLSVLADQLSGEDNDKKSRRKK